VVNQKPLRTTLAHPTPELPVEDVERAQQHCRDALEKKPWGLRQFTVEDIDGNRFYSHSD
jgi:hypothetical protein